MSTPPTPVLTPTGSGPRRGVPLVAWWGEPVALLLGPASLDDRDDPTR
ncbi:MAG TPA: hypothetical protein VK866_12700 [Acidimicrobiales bacterium]|nr:hypothetical protein [Acidimicrobiales bacterium]